MVRMNITSSDGRDLTVACIEQTSDAKLANITDMSRYNAGPSGTPPASPHWFVCGGSQLFIYPTGKGDAWGVKPPEPEWQVIDGYNVSTKMRLDPVEKVLSIAQTLYCDDGPADWYVNTSTPISKTILHTSLMLVGCLCPGQILRWLTSPSAVSSLTPPGRRDFLSWTVGDEQSLNPTQMSRSTLRLWDLPFPCHYSMVVFAVAQILESWPVSRRNAIYRRLISVLDESSYSIVLKVLVVNYETV